VAKPPHKFILGQAVGYTPPIGTGAARGIYVVIEKLPERDGEPQYRIRHTNGSAEFTVKESELRRVTG
jgi:hypothetical protein